MTISRNFRINPSIPEEAIAKILKNKSERYKELAPLTTQYYDVNEAITDVEKSNNADRALLGIYAAWLCEVKRKKPNKIDFINKSYDSTREDKTCNDYDINTVADYELMEDSRYPKDILLNGRRMQWWFALPDLGLFVCYDDALMISLKYTGGVFIENYDWSSIDGYTIRNGRDSFVKRAFISAVYDCKDINTEYKWSNYLGFYDYEIHPVNPSVTVIDIVFISEFLFDRIYQEIDNELFVVRQALNKIAGCSFSLENSNATSFLTFVEECLIPATKEAPPWCSGFKAPPSDENLYKFITSSTNEECYKVFKMKTMASFKSYIVNPYSNPGGNRKYHLYMYERKTGEIVEKFFWMPIDEYNKFMLYKGTTRKKRLR